MNPDKSLSSQAYGIVKAQIMEGALAPGQIISISKLAEELNISRTPVTLACQRLEDEKFLTIAPKQGVVINTISVDEAREIYELRAAIESYVAARLFDHITPADIAFLKESNAKQRSAMTQNDVRQFMREDTAFHKYILSRHDNSHIFSILNNIYDRGFLLGVKSCQNSSRMEESIAEHEAIINALESGDKNLFVQTVEVNILKGYASITGNLLYT